MKNIFSIATALIFYGTSEKWDFSNRLESRKGYVIGVSYRAAEIIRNSQNLPVRWVIFPHIRFTSSSWKKSFRRKMCFNYSSHHGNFSRKASATGLCARLVFLIHLTLYQAPFSPQISMLGISMFAIWTLQWRMNCGKTALRSPRIKIWNSENRYKNDESWWIRLMLRSFEFWLNLFLVFLALATRLQSLRVIMGQLIKSDFLSCKFKI